MLKVTVIGHRTAMDDVVLTLQRAGALEIEQSPFEELDNATLAPDDARVRAYEEHLAQMQFVRDFLGRYHKNEQPFSTFVSEKFHIGQDQYHALAFGAHHNRLYHECVDLADTLAHGERERLRLTQLVADLEPWEALRLQISEWEGTANTVLFTGTVPASEGPEIRQRLRDEVANVTVEELGPKGLDQAWVVIAHRSCVDEVRTVLASTRFTEIQFPGLEDYPAEEMANARDQIAELDRATAVAEQRAQEISDVEFHDAVTIVLALESQHERVAIRGDIAETEAAFLISGWLPESEAATVREMLSRFEGDLDVTLSEPADEDEPPVQLTNPRFLQPFEILTDLYGRPRYRDADPTPVLAPFFLLFFSICIGDFGYGAMLIAGAWLIKKRLDIAPGVKKFMDLLILGGAGAMVVGVALGGYFAIPVDRLPQVLQDLQVIDPIEDIQLFLVAALVLGVVQVFFGVILAAVHAFKRGDAASAFFDHISVLILFGSITVAVVTGQMVWLVGWSRVHHARAGQGDHHRAG